MLGLGYLRRKLKSVQNSAPSYTILFVILMMPLLQDQAHSSLVTGRERECSVTQLLTDLFVRENQGPGFKILPKLPGSTENYPLGLTEVPDHRILFGIEAEYSDQASLGKLSTFSKPKTENFWNFYSRHKNGLRGGSFEDPVLYKLPESSESGLSPEGKLLKNYLPKATVKESGKIDTHEIVTDILPNQTTFLKVLKSLNHELGNGSYQAMMSIPREAVIKRGQAEMEGLLVMSNELSTLSAIANPRPFHPLLHPYNPPMGNYSRLPRGETFRHEMSHFFDRPGLSTAPVAGELSNPKYTLGAAARFDLSDGYQGKSRFFIELRGCKGNVQCVENLSGQLTNIFENGRLGFNEFSKLESLTGGSASPWRTGHVWQEIPFSERREITGKLKNLFFINTSIPDAGEHFLYPFKGWETLPLGNGFPMEKLIKAQEAYLVELLKAVPSKSYPEAMEILTPALKNFAKDSGMLDYLKANWKRITQREWDVEF